MGDLGQNELDRLATGRKLGFEFAIDPLVHPSQYFSFAVGRAGHHWIRTSLLGLDRVVASCVETVRRRASAGLDPRTIPVDGAVSDPLFDSDDVS